MKAAIVVQRYGAGIVGGSETLARQYAQMLRQDIDVEVLTTCAADHGTWENYFPAAATVDEGVSVRRFAVDYPRARAWEELYELLLESAPMPDFLESFAVKDAHAARLARWPRALQEETIHRQGPYSSTLLDHLALNGQQYAVVLFVSYLYPTAYDGMQRLPHDRIVFVPTLHDEPVAYLSVYQRLFRRSRQVVFLTDAERALARRLYGFTGPSDVVGMAISTPAAEGELPPGTPSHYVIYAGRIEEGKGVLTLFDYFRAFQAERPSACKLVLIGNQTAPLPSDPNIVYLGYVSEATKFALLKGACALVQPSSYESFGIVLLESLAVGTPVLANGRNEVLAEHCRQSGAGLTYRTRQEFVQNLWRLAADARYREILGRRGRTFVRQRFAGPIIADKLVRIVRRAAGKPARVSPCSKRGDAGPSGLDASRYNSG
jgi:glycosyltransferase involved in cell wall biosynthesis